MSRPAPAASRRAPAGGLAVTAPRSLIGRDAELERLTRGLRRRPGQGTVAIVDGEPGIGKTALVAAAAAGFAPIRSVGVRNSASTGFGGLHQLLRPLLGGLRALPPRHRAALSTALGLSPGDPPDRLMISLGALGLVEEAAHRRPLLLVAEDAHWLDRSSLDVLAFLARRIRHLPVMLIITLRGDAHPVELRPVTAERLHLPPLPDDAIAAILDRRGHAPARPDRDRILRAARGNPLAALELAAALGRDRPAASADFSPRLPTTSRLESAFLDRVADLPGRSRELLLLAAAGEGMPLPEVMSAARRSGLGPEDMAPLQRAGLVTVTGAAVTFRHPLLPSAVYGSAPAGDLRRAHRILAEVTTDAGRVAWHRAAASGDQDDAAAASLEEAARLAQRRGAQAEASAAYARAARLTRSTPNLGRRLALAAQAAYLAARMDDAGGLLREATALVDDPDSIVRVATTHLSIGLAEAVPGMGTDDFRSLSRRLGGADGRGYPEQRAGVLWCAAVNCRGNDLPRPQWRGVEADLDRIVTASPMKTLALATVAEPARAATLRPLLPALLDRVPETAYAMIAVAIAAEAVHDHRTALSAWHLGVEFSHRAGAPVDEAQSLRGRSTQRFLAGDLAGALADADQAVHTAGDAGARHVAGMAAAVAALYHVWRGDHRAARQMLGHLGATPGEPGGMASADGHWAAGLLALAEDRPADAWAHLVELRWHPVRALWTVADLTEAAVLTGRSAEITGWLDDASAQAAAFGSARLIAVVERALALTSDGSGAAAHYEASIAAGARADAPLELARTRLHFGQWLRRNRRADESRDHLALALSAFSAAHATRWAERAERELRASGMPARPAGAARPDRPALTPQELQIAALAASGLTNKEIADRVYHSHRTVGAVLYRVFPKLGITRRAQLRAALHDLGETG